MSRVLTYLIIFLGKIFIFIRAFWSRFLGPNVMKLVGFRPSFMGLLIVTG